KALIIIPLFLLLYIGSNSRYSLASTVLAGLLLGSLMYLFFHTYYGTYRMILLNIISPLAINWPRLTKNSFVIITISILLASFVIFVYLILQITPDKISRPFLLILT